jgi:ribose 5-phosphate isomerase B
MKLGIASDHGGFELKKELIAKLKAEGHEVVDFGADTYAAGDDYPDYVIPMAKAVAAGQLERGIAVCGSGVGACIAVNKVKGARAALVHDHFSAHQGVEDDDMNIICLGGRIIGGSVAWEIAQVFLASKFTHAERHSRRVGKVKAVEAEG